MMKMTSMTIAQSVREELVYIGKAGQAGGLWGRLGKTPSKAERKASQSEGWRLEVSWAETTDADSAKVHEAALVQAYIAEHDDNRPGFQVPGNQWVPGNSVTPRTQGPTGDLQWTDWQPMLILVESPGVYRIRAVQIAETS